MLIRVTLDTRIIPEELEILVKTTPEIEKIKVNENMIAKAFFSEYPDFKKSKVKWSPLFLKGKMCFFKRTKLTKTVSNMGRPKINIGENSAIFLSIGA